MQRWTFLVLMLGAACASLGAGCSEEREAPLPLYPTVDELAAHPELPDLFTSWRGERRATSAEDFQTWRSAELRALFAHYVYGEVPPYAEPLGVRSVARADDLLGGKATYEELEITVRPGAARLYLAVFAPKDRPGAPVVLGPNRCGNQSILADARIRETTSFVPPACKAEGLSSRGGSAAIWPVETMVDRGVALATFHETDAEPDEGGSLADGLRGTYLREDGTPFDWGTISVWAFAVSRALDALGGVPAVDAGRVAVFGNSRRGKTALWAAANDPRIAMVMAHQSGTAGAALARSPIGESIQAITTIYPQWFTDTFRTFSGAEEKLPIDQHQLLALLAPRPVLLTDGRDDTWADPPGARMAAEAATPAWALFGAAGLAPAGAPDGSLVWRERPGGHAVLPEDWTGFLDFVEQHARPRP